MADKKKKTAKTKNKGTPDPYGPWIPMRTGLIIITVASVSLAVFTIWQTYGPLTFGESLRYGLVRGGSIWVIFIGVYLFNRWLRGR